MYFNFLISDFNSFDITFALQQFGNHLFMNKYLYFVSSLFLFLFVTSCVKYSNKDILTQAHSIIEDRPDSALILLESIEDPESLNQNDYAQYGLLLIQAHKMNKISIKSDDFITYIVNYYEAHPSDKLGRAYSYAGQVLEAQGKYDEAEKYYLKAIGFDSNNTPRAKSYSAYFLADMYSNNLQNYKKAIEYYNLSIKYFKEYQLDFKEENILKLIGDSYVKDHQLDEGVKYYRLAKDKISRDSTKILVDLLQNIAVTLTNLDKYPEARYAITRAIELSKANSNLAICHAIKGDILEKQNLKDSAIYYNNEAINYAKKIDNQDVLLDAYQSIYRIAAKSNKPQLALDNYINFNEITETLGQKQKYDDIKLLEKRIDFEKNRSQYRANRLKVQSIIFLITLVVIVIPVAFAYYRNRKKKYIRQISEVLEARNETIRSVMKARHQNLDLYKRMVILSMSPQKSKYRSFLETANKILLGHDYEFEFDWEYASSLVNTTYHNYVVRLTEKYPTLTELEVKICILLKIGFSLTEISDITGKSTHTIYKYSSHIRKKLEISDNTHTVEFIDNSLAL